MVFSNIQGITETSKKEIQDIFREDVYGGNKSEDIFLCVSNDKWNNTVKIEILKIKTIWNR